MLVDFTLLPVVGIVMFEKLVKSPAVLSKVITNEGSTLDVNHGLILASVYFPFLTVGVLYTPATNFTKDTLKFIGLTVPS